MIKQNKFKDARGVWRTRTLFADLESTEEGSKENAPYWLYTKEDSRPCLRDEFIECDDLTGIRFGRKYFGSYEHFKILLDCSWFKREYDLWLEELTLIRKSDALKAIELIAIEEGPQRFQANKYLANKEYEDSPTTKRGRPSKDEVSGNLKQEIRRLTAAEEDYKRMTGGLTLIQGGKN